MNSLMSNYPWVACGFTLIVIACFGALGGLVSGFFIRKFPSHAGDYTVELDPAIPSSLRHIANAIVGIVGAFAFVPFGARILDLNFTNLISKDRLEDTLKCVLFMISLASIGGFAGYRFLETLANKMLDRLVDELGKRTKVLEQSKHDLERKTTDLQQANETLEGSNALQQLELLEARANLQVNDGAANSENVLGLIDEFFAKLSRSKYVPADLVANAYKQRARAFKKIGKINEALDTVNTALKYRDISPTVRAVLLFNKACYSSLLLRRSASEDEASAVVENLRECYKLFRFKKQEALKDKDFDNIRETEAFKAFQGE